MNRDLVYAWGNNPKRATFKGRYCRVVCRGAMRSVLIEFSDNGERAVTSARALRHPSLGTPGGNRDKERGSSPSG